MFQENIVASNEDWTHDLWFTRPTLCHWAIEAPAEWLPLSVQQDTIGRSKVSRGHTDLNHGPIGLQPIALPLSYIPKTIASHPNPWTTRGRWFCAGTPVLSGAPMSAKRRWYNGQHSCLPSSWSGFDSRLTQIFLNWFQFLLITIKFCIFV